MLYRSVKAFYVDGNFWDVYLFFKWILASLEFSNKYFSFSLTEFMQVQFKIILTFSLVSKSSSNFIYLLIFYLT